MGAAMAMTARELVVVVVFMVCLRGSAMDRHSQLATLKSAIACGIVIGAHIAMKPLGIARLALDAMLYGVLMLGLRIVRPSDVGAVLKLVKNRRNAA